jgi:EAL domain-containing protein (putative c-di-GMP-specific phosphodiesterase class I)
LHHLAKPSVTHITLSKKTTGKPSVEFYSDGSGEARRVTIENFPFRIGRSETADLRIESVQVSREHAEIVERNGMWLVRDLGSTNGTEVNGKTIHETLLADGDILKIAETELTFLAAPASQFQRMVTQPIQAKKAAAVSTTLPEAVAAARMVTEATLWQAVPTRLLAARSLRHNANEAFFALSVASGKQLLFDQLHPAGDRYRELVRMRALELAVERADTTRLLISVAATEIESPHRLFMTLKELQAQTPSAWELGIVISLPIDVDILRIGEIYREARDHRLLVAFDEFQGNGAQVMHLESLLPDYLVLAGSMTRDLASTRQPMRRLESLLSACNGLMIKPILPYNDSNQTVSLCQEMGFDLVLQRAHRKTALPVREPSITV